MVVEVEIAKGYKRTEVGVIPVDWKVTTLVELIQSGKGIRYGIVQPGKYDPNGRFMIRGQDYSFGWVKADEIFRVSDEVEIRYQNARVKKGDLLITIVGAGTGHVEIVPEWLDGANLTQTTARLSIDEKKGNPIYCKYFLLGNDGKRQTNNFIKGAAQPGLNCGDIEKFLIPLPTLAEQTAIATALSETDALLTSLDKLIQKKRNIKQGAMQMLLTGKKRLPGFEGEWVVKRLGDIAEMYSGGTPSTSNASYYGGEIPWITSSDLNKKEISEVEGRITEEGFKNSASKMVDADTLLIALYGATAGVSAITKINAAINQAVLAFIPKVDNPIFIFNKISFYKNWIITTFTQGGQPNLSGGIIKAIEFTFPPTLEEQTAIATVLSDMDAELAALEAKRAKLAAVKVGMMGELLTGKIRLIDKNTAP